MSEPDDNTPCDFEAELPLLLYQGELAREERERLKSHLATCARCAEALAQLESTAVVLDGAMAVPKPTDEQWKKLKTDILARVAGPATASEKPSEPAAEEACESIEEDLLVLNEVGPERKKQVTAHLDKCALCRETRSAFGSIGLVLNRDPLVWPAIERWDSLKETVLTTVEGEVKRAKDSARAKQITSMPIPRASWGGYARAAAAVILLIGVAGAASLLRGPTADEVRRLYREAQGGGTLAVVTRNYELVVKQGIDKPECRGEVDDALLQLQAIHHFENAMSQPNRDLKVVQLREGIAKWPGAQVTQLALANYQELVPVAPQQAVPSRGGFATFPKPGEQPFKVGEDLIHRYAADLERQFVSLAEIADEKGRKKKEGELRTALSGCYMQLGRSENLPRDKALGYYKKAAFYAPPGSTAWNDAQKYIEQFSR